LADQPCLQHGPTQAAYAHERALPAPAPAKPRPTLQLGIGPDARPKRKKPNREGWAKRLYY